ncbi:MAG: Gfo/Idh/MocA family oxidoreductase [Lentisphaeria bacterium]|nr:Gfo/Idh/MocA family oxidoreductase [Lentisphaeria bacterium]
MGQKRALRVAVLGTGGIGKHHAKWWHVEGADVCAFLGRTGASVTAAGQKLAAMFPFSGVGFTSLDQLLREARPDIVDVCTPMERHFGHARAALLAGCHVLCEKPFVYDASLSADAMLTQARELLALAESRGLRFGVCTQYVVAAKLCLAMRADRLDPLDSYRGYLVSPTRGRSPHPPRTWVDLAPHMIGALQAVCPGGAVVWETVRLDFAGHRARALFDLRQAGGGMVQCDIHTNHTDVEPRNVRQFVFNGYPFDIDGYNDAQGIFQARIHTPDGDEDREDAMRILIRHFRDGVCEVPGPMALQNLDWMLRFLALAEAGPQASGEDTAPGVATS